MFIAARIFGILGIIGAIWVFQQKERSKLLFFKLLTDCCWCAHYICLGAISGAGICIIAILRSIIFLQRGRHKWAESKFWLFFFLGCCILCAILTWKNALTLLTAAVSIGSVISFWIGRPSLSRKMSIPIASCSLVYDIFNGSIEGILNESFVIISSIVGYFRLDRKKNAVPSTLKEKK